MGLIIVRIFMWQRLQIVGNDWNETNVVQLRVYRRKVENNCFLRYLRRVWNTKRNNCEGNFI